MENFRVLLPNRNLSYVYTLLVTICGSPLESPLIWTISMMGSRDNEPDAVAAAIVLAWVIWPSPGEGFYIYLQHIHTCMYVQHTSLNTHTYNDEDTLHECNLFSLVLNTAKTSMGGFYTTNRRVVCYFFSSLVFCRCVFQILNNNSTYNPDRFVVFIFNRRRERFLVKPGFLLLK